MMPARAFNQGSSGASRSGFGLAIGALAAGVLAWTTGPASAITLAYVDIINTNDPTFNQALGINNAGTIAGYYGSGAPGHPNQGYTVVPPFSQANFTPVNPFNSVQTQVTGLNNAPTPSLVGFFANTNTGTDSNFGFITAGGGIAEVNNPNTGTTPPVINQLLGVNDNDLTVGFYIDAAGVTHGYTFDLPTGTYSPNIDFPTAANTTAAAINNDGTIVGFYSDAAGAIHGFANIGGAFKTIDVPGATTTSLLGVNIHGMAVGFDIDAAIQMHGIVCDTNTGVREEHNHPNGVGTTTFNGINDAGNIVGFYVDAEGHTIGLVAAPLETLAPVPEPGSLALLSVGLFGIGVICRRSAAARKPLSPHLRDSTSCRSRK
jgi:uncharacterized membrane protein